MKKMTHSLRTALVCMALLLFVSGTVLLAPAAHAENTLTPGVNLVFNNGTMDGILADGETERTLNGDWGVSYPVATFGSATADSPAVIRQIDGNAVLVLEHSSGNFASFFADLWADGVNLPAGKYELSMDIKAVGTAFSTDNVGFNLYNQYTDVRIYDNGWQNCTEGSNGWMHYSRVFELNEGTVDSIQMWFNTMGTDSTLYIDNLSFCAYNENPAPDNNNPNSGDASGIVALSAACVLSMGAVCVLVPFGKKHEN